jgi:hypothetical protein
MFRKMKKNSAPCCYKLPYGTCYRLHYRTCNVVIINKKTGRRDTELKLDTRKYDNIGFDYKSLDKWMKQYILSKNQTYYPYNDKLKHF